MFLKIFYEVSVVFTSPQSVRETPENISNRSGAVKTLSSLELLTKFEILRNSLKFPIRKLEFF